MGLERGVEPVVEEDEVRQERCPALGREAFGGGPESVVEADDCGHPRQRPESGEELASRVGVAGNVLEGEVVVEQLRVQVGGRGAAVVEDRREGELGSLFFLEGERAPAGGGHEGDPLAVLDDMRPDEVEGSREFEYDLVQVDPLELRIRV